MRVKASINKKARKFTAASGFTANQDAGTMTAPVKTDSKEA